MENAAIITVLLFAVVMLAVAFLLPVIPAKMAEKKGRSFGAWYLFGFFLWIPAIICAALIDDRLEKLRQEEREAELELRHAEMIAALRQPQPATAPQWAPPAGPPAV